MGAPRKRINKPDPGPGINFGGGDGSEVPLRECKNIHEAVVAIMEEVGYVRKTRGANLNYTYAGEAALISAIRPWMVAYGVYMTVVGIAAVSEVDHPRPGDRGGNTRVATITSTVRFTHAPSGTFVDVMARGEGADVSDKANNKAQTAAYKYALRQTFCIETGEDPDSTRPYVPHSAGQGGVASGSASGSPAPARPPVKDADGFELDDPGAAEAEAQAHAAMEAEAAQTGSTGAGSAPAGTAPEKAAIKLAQIHISQPVRPEFDRWVKQLITKYPAYSAQRQGKPTSNPDYSHIRATAASLGYAELADGNYQEVLQAIAKHAAEKVEKAGAEPEKAPEKAPAKDPTKAASNKRPSNDEALKRAGF